jgi:hypothetical protein
LKSVISSLDESPTSFASSNIRTFPVAKICLSRCRRAQFPRSVGPAHEPRGACTFPHLIDTLQCPGALRAHGPYALVLFSMSLSQI